MKLIYLQITAILEMEQWGVKKVKSQAIGSCHQQFSKEQFLLMEV